MKDDVMVLPTKNFSSQYVLNMALGTFISKQMISILKSSKRIIFMEMLKRIFGILGENYLVILQYIDKYILKNIFVRTFKYLLNIILRWVIKPILGIKNDEKTKKINVKFTPTLVFMQKFIKYMKPENYTIVPIHNIKLQQQNIIIYKQTWVNINVVYEDTRIKLYSKLKLTFEKTNDDINLVNFNIKNDTVKISEPIHKIELELFSNSCDENELYNKFNKFIFYINSL